MSLAPPRYIDTAAALAAWVAHLQQATLIAVDTESDSLHRYREKVCLIQMSALGQDAILDPLRLPSLQPLAALFSAPRYTKIFHDAGYDLICLQRDFDLQVCGIFDTMWASRLLGNKNFGLAALLQERCGFTADKRMQRSDWAQRPLSAQQLIYAQYDTHFLPSLAQQLQQELQARGRWAWAQEDFARLPQLAARSLASNLARENTPEQAPSFWRVRGVSALSPWAKGRLKVLYEQREQLARQLDRPPFKVCHDAVLLSWASATGLSPRAALRPFAAQLWRAMARAVPIFTPPPVGCGKRRRAHRNLEPLARARFEALRSCRRAAATQLGLEPEVALSNAILEVLARHPPRSLAALQAQPDLQGWRGQLLADGLWAALATLPALAAPASA